MRVAIFEDDKGRCNIVSPSASSVREGIDLDLLFSEASKGKEYTVVETHELPDKYFRDAWKKHNKIIKIDMHKARQIHMDNIRIKRNIKLAELDVETLKGNDVEEQKQILRDIPANFDLTIAKTPTDLKKLMPENII